MRHQRRTFGLIPLAALALAMAPLQAGAIPAGKVDPDGWTPDKIKTVMPEYFMPGGPANPYPVSGPVAPIRAGARSTTEALPDVSGPGAVLTVGNIFMKVTNWGHNGIFFTNLSSDPGGQWPGASGIEYLSTIRLAVGAVNPFASDPAAVRRVSYLFEWRPQTLDPEDKIYRAYDGAINGARYFNDDGDSYFDPGSGLAAPFIDEDFLDGRDNDGDGQIDEDYGALGQQMYSFSMWDNTIQAINTTFNEKHVPLGLECREKAWAYSIAGFQDFNVMEYEIFNRSGHELDSLVVGFLVDMDSGPTVLSNYFQDDFAVPNIPNGDFVIRVGGTQGDLPDPRRRQDPPHLEVTDRPDTAALCPSYHLRINGFSLADDNGDDGRTTGVPSFLLFTHTTDPLGINGPSRVGFRAFRAFTFGQPYTQGGNPTIDQQRFEFMTGNSSGASGGYENIDPETGFISTSLEPVDTRADYGFWCSMGIWRHIPDGGSISVTVGFAVAEGSYQRISQYRSDFMTYLLTSEDQKNAKAVEMMGKYKPLANAISAQIAYEGIHERREGFPATDFHGRETAVKLPPGSPDNSVQLSEPECPGREQRTVFLSARYYSWFDFDCSYCTGVWDENIPHSGDPTLAGLFHKTWNAAAPPPNPNVNVSSAYNFTDNPHRDVVAAGDHKVTLAWDNLSETTPDPKTQWFDFRGYRIWKVADWSRPVGAAGPSETDWKLIGEFRLFDFRDDHGKSIERNFDVDPVTGEQHCPEVYIPNYVWRDSTGAVRQGKKVPICLERGDLWDSQSGEIIKPNLCFACDTVAGGPPIFGAGELNSCGLYRLGSSYSHRFDTPGTYGYLCQRHGGRGGSVTVAAGGADSAKVQIIDHGESEFSPTAVTIRPGGTVRWINTSTYTHTVTSESNCNRTQGCELHSRPCIAEIRSRYPVGRYQYVDPEVKNGFVYFYSVTAFDSTFDNSITTELGGRRSAVESEAVFPQSGASLQKGGVWVVPNPYRDFLTISARPSSWDLTPNASDPTGRHLDFFGLPSGPWTIKIFTVSGDLVAELHWNDPVNDALRAPVKIGETPDHQPINAPGFNRQQDNPNDGQARWNLISRNGQDIVSGIYLFTVDSSLGSQRGKFVVIR